MPTWIVFLLVLSVLVLVHELGHFLAAKLFKIRVEEFAFGLPFTKPILKFKWRGTQYSIYPLLFGGFVKLLGEEGPAIGEDNFWGRGKKQRLAVIGAGVVMNVILALVCFGILYSNVGVPSSARSKVTVVQVAPGSPAEQEGIKPLDRILTVEGKDILGTGQFGEVIQSWGGVKVNIVVERGETTPLFEGIAEGVTQTQKLAVVPRKKPPEGEGALGVTIADYPYMQMKQCKIYNLKCVGSILTQGVKSTGVWMGRVLDGLRSVGQSLVAGKTPEGMAGPVGIYQLTGFVAAEGWLPLLELVAVLSVNLAVFNFLPVPALDGGRMLFIWLEYIFRKRIPAEVEQKINSWGMTFLLTLMALVSLQDVIRMGWLASLWTKIVGK
jgi:regulator of sigma E protease